MTLPRSFVWIQPARTLRLAVGLAAVVLAAGSNRALGQGPLPLPPEVVCSVAPLSEAQKQTVAGFVAKHSENLTPADATPADAASKMRDDRAALVEPLGRDCVTASFRATYAPLLEAKASAMAGSKIEVIAINGVVIAGELSSPSGLKVLEAAAKDTRASVRYQAAFALRRTLEGVAKGNSLLSVEQARSAIEATGPRLTSESDPLVVNALVEALATATRIPAQRDTALRTLGSASAASVRGKKSVLDDTSLQAYVRAGVAIRDTLTDGAAPNQEALRASAELGGAMLGHAMTVVENKTLVARASGGEAQRDAYARFVGIAETVVLTAGKALDPAGKYESRGVVEKVKDGTTQRDASFLADAMSYVGAGGLLTKAPYNLPPR